MAQATTDHPSRRLPVGAELLPEGGVHFRVWAANASRVEVVFESNLEPLELSAETDGYFAGLASKAQAGTLYKLRLDGRESYPDMASRFQPQGPHGPSEIVDPGQYQWRDEGWRGPDRNNVILYEMHIGTFTERGTWEAAADHLSELAELGINAVELMPVAEFPGKFGWGYDGVDFFAPYHGYGTPDEMRRFVDRAHALGIAVILDVVYNHFGPDGAYAKAYSQSYFHHERGANDWGETLNFDGPHSQPVRSFFVANAVYWITEFHLDGLRFDACQAIHDHSEIHILAEISRHCREAAGTRAIYLIAEHEPQETRLFAPLNKRGYGLDAVWTDDFHHSARVALTGRAEAYYCDYQGSPQELISAVKWGFLFQGTFNGWQQKIRGTPSLRSEPSRFITYLETHDQVANSALGHRLLSLTDSASYRAMVALWLLSPQTPMLFQGQEWGSTRPFYYFGDHNEALARLIYQGRLNELADFPSMKRADMAKFMAVPSDESTFRASKLNRSELSSKDKNPIYALFRDLIQLRRNDPVFRALRSDWIHGAVLGPTAFALRFLGEEDEDRLIVINLGRDLYPAPATEPLLASPAGAVWSVLWSSEDYAYGGSGIPTLDTRRPWRIPGHAAIVLAPDLMKNDHTASGGLDSPHSIVLGNSQDVSPKLLNRLLEQRES